MGIATGSCGAHGGQVACPSAHGCRVSPPTHPQINETSYCVNNFEATEYTSTLHKGLPTKFMSEITMILSLETISLPHRSKHSRLAKERRKNQGEREQDLEIMVLFQPMMFLVMFPLSHLKRREVCYTVFLQKEIHVPSSRNHLGVLAWNNSKTHYCTYALVMCHVS